MKGRLARHLCRFTKAESGALLVFFAMCCAAIFLIAALSFDLGKRASTQSELQSFADNVALAAAGELNGRPGAVARAQRAANRLIQDQATFAEGDGTLAGSSDFRISFHAVLPFDEAQWNTGLQATESASDQAARFVRVEVNPVQVPWSFARVLGVFSNAPLPSENVAAEATAGYSAMACDVAPVFFCMPPAEPGVDTGGVWDPANHIGDTINLTATSGQASNWGAGSLGFFDASLLTDSASFCDGLNGIELHACLAGSGTRRTQCFENGALLLQDGAVSDEGGIYLNMRMDRFARGYRKLGRVRAFHAPPIATKAVEESTMCLGSGGNPTDDAMSFPPDDCFAAGGAGCTAFNGTPRVGNGDWSDGRLTYVEINYSRDGENLGTIDPSELVMIHGDQYHIDDPFRPGDVTHPRHPDHVDFPLVLASGSRWNYYNAEIAAAYFEEPASAYLGDDVDLSGYSALRGFDPFVSSRWFRLHNGGWAFPIDLLPDLEMADGSTSRRQGTNLPLCAQRVNLNPRRRAFVAAAVDCGSQPINGAAEARATWFVELFMLEPVTDHGGGGFNFHAEVISGGLQNGGASLFNGTFRNFAQLFR